MIPATIAWQLQELARRILYTEGRLGAAFVNDCVAYGGQALGVVLIWQIGHLNGVNALYVLAATSFVGALLGFAQTRNSFGRSVNRGDLVAHWRFGKWLAAAAIAFGASGYAYFYIAALLLGTAASGELKASQLVLGPLNVLLIFVATILPIRLSYALTFKGESAFLGYLRRAFAVTAPAVGIYCLLASLFAGSLLELFYGNRYRDAVTLVALFAVYYFVSYVGQMTASALNARRNTRPIFVANLAGAVSTLLLGWLFISVAGVDGAVLGMIASALLVDVILARYASYDMRRVAVDCSAEHASARRSVPAAELLRPERSASHRPTSAPQPDGRQPEAPPLRDAGQGHRRHRRGRCPTPRLFPARQRVLPRRAPRPSRSRSLPRRCG